MFSKAVDFPGSSHLFSGEIPDAGDTMPPRLLHLPSDHLVHASVRRMHPPRDPPRPPKRSHSVLTSPPKRSHSVLPKRQDHLPRRPGCRRRLECHTACGVLTRLCVCVCHSRECAPNPTASRECVWQSRVCALSRTQPARVCR